MTPAIHVVPAGQQHRRALWCWCFPVDASERWDRRVWLHRPVHDHGHVYTAAERVSRRWEVRA